MTCEWRFGALAVFALLLFVPAVRASAANDQHNTYMLNCQGCHRANGEGIPGKVPDMRRTLAVLATTAAGRRYLVQVPGADQSPLSNAELAKLLNWMVHHLSAVAVPKSVRPFTTKEVAAYRGEPLINVAAVRRRLLARLLPHKPRKP